MANSPLGQRWLKRVVVEGYTDARGSYLYNLDLSQRRAQAVIHALLTRGETTLSLEELAEVERLFMVGGFSSHAQLATAEASRRVELRLDFKTLAEQGATDAAERLSDDLQIGQCLEVASR
ncbi:MAG: OmpA family protein [Gammaproteobacteria bacterium]|nr:OmpA family protein [Gammaproteobacteria bacterium]